MAIKLGILGVSGKMGKTLVSQTLLDPDLTLVAGCGSPQSKHLGKDIGALVQCEPIGVYVENDLSKAFSAADVLIDFSLPNATQTHLEHALSHRKPLLIGSTGHSDLIQEKILSIAKEIPLFFSPNFSFGIMLCLQMVSLFGKYLKNRCHVDIIETHHAQKKDHPSGTAKALGKALGFDDFSLGPIPAQRGKETLCIHSIRTGNVIGEHRIVFECAGERIELKHEALSRQAFALGAIEAAKFLIKQPPGLYTQIYSPQDILD